MAISRLTSWLSRVISPAKSKVTNVKLRAELLETRDVPATFTVTSDGFSLIGAFPTGPRSESGLTFAAAIVLNNKTPGLNRILFNIPPIVNASNTPEFARRALLVPTGGLPIITNPVIIDGTPQPSQSTITNGKTNYGIGQSGVLNALAKGTPGIVIDSGTINGQITAFHHFNIGATDTIPFFWSTTLNRVIPFSSDGGAGAIGGFPGSGVIVGPSGRVVITGSNLSNNGFNTSDLTTWTGNNGLTGAAKVTITVYSRGDGIDIYGGGQNIGSNIGGTGTAEGNTISNNAQEGVFIAPEVGLVNDPSFNEILQDTIFGNGEDGVLIQDASDNLIGSPVDPNGTNWVYSNVTNGIFIQSTTNAFLATRNRIQGNEIGRFPPPTPTETTSTASRNGENGVLLYNAPNTLIGGTQAVAGNVIVNSTTNGIAVTGTGGSTGVVIQQNTIGTQPQPNLLDGIFIVDSPGVLIGGANTATNTIQWNDRSGVEVQQDANGNSNGGQIINNIIQDNVREGVLINQSVSFTIGGPALSSGNRFINNGSAGIEIDNQTNPVSPVNRPTVIQGNTFSGNAADGNQIGIVDGSILIDNSSNIQIGGTPPQAGNTIDGSSNGMVIRAGSKNVTVQGNKIGTGGFGSNSLDGIVVDGLPDPLFNSGVAGNIQIGTTANGGANIIDGSRNGVVVKNGATNVTIQADTISNNTQNGIIIFDDPVDALGNPVTAITTVTIGGASNVLTRNVITGNFRSGISLSGQYTINTVVQNNLIGVEKNGTANGNLENGIEIDGSSLNTIGGETSTARNVIVNNAGNGIRIENLDPANTAPFGNVISGNSIGTDATGALNEGNGGTGVLIDGSGSNTVGGYDPAATSSMNPGNVIAFNGRNGVTVYDTQATGNSQDDAIIGNTIYSNALLAIDIGDDLGTVNLNQNPPYSGTGPNQFQNFPVLATAQSGLVGSEITGSITSTPGQYRIEFFGDPSANAGGSIPGYGQGQVYLGFENVIVGASGTATFTFATTQSVKGGTVVSATATNITAGLPGPTSEMAQSIPVTIAIGQINGRVFNDLNATYTDLPGDPGLSGWVVDLYAGNDTTVDASTTTGANGAYSFGTLTDGIYTIKEVVPTSWVETFTPTPDPMQITGGVTLNNVDFGNFQALTISGHKFNDLNNSGHNDPGDPGLAGVQFELWQIEANNSKLGLAIALSDLNGNFQFTNVAPTFQPVPAPSGTELNPILASSNTPGPITLEITEIVPIGWTLTTGNPPEFNITSGKNVSGLLWGDHKGGGGGGGGGSNVGAIDIVGSGPGMQATVLVYTGAKTPKLLYTIHPYGNFTGGVTVAAGDVNGDGQDDIIVGPGPGLNSILPGEGSLVAVYDGNTGKLIEQLLPYGSFNGGVFVAGADVNGDGFADIVTGPMAGGGPNVKVFDGLTGIGLFNFNAYAPNYTGGVRVAAGDVNADGFADIITAPGAGMAPLVEEWSGATYGTGTETLLNSFYAFSPLNTGGVFISTEYTAGNAFANIVAGSGSGVPMVSTFDGLTGTQLSNFQVGPAANNPSQILGQSSWTTGVHVGALGFDGTGVDDVLTGSGPLRPAQEFGYNAITGKLLLTLNPFSQNFLGGVWVAGGDDPPTVVIPAPGSGGVTGNFGPGQPAISGAYTGVSVTSSTVVSGSTDTVNITVKNIYGDVVAGIPSSYFSLSLTGGQSTATFGPVTPAGSPGVYTATLTGVKAGTASKVTVVVNGVTVTSQPSVTVTPGGIDGGMSTANFANATDASGKTDLVTIVVKDSAGNGIPGLTNGSFNLSLSGGTSTGTFGVVTGSSTPGVYTANFTGALAGTASTLTVNVNGIQIASQPLVTVVPGAVSATNSTVSLASPTNASGTTDQLTIVVKDAAGNAVTGLASNAFSFTVSGGKSTGTVGSVTPTATPGTYTALFTGNIAGSASKITVKVSGTQISTAPSVTVTPGAVSASKSTVKFAASSVLVGKTDVVTIVVKDAAGNAITGLLNSDFNLTLTGASQGTFGQVTETSTKGTYTVVFTATTPGTASSLLVDVDGTGILIQPLVTVHS